MKFVYILAWIICFGVFTSVEAQTTSDSATANAGETSTLFSTPVENTLNGNCSLIQRDEKDRKIYTYKNGYKIVTEESDEVVKVKNQKDGDTKLTYYNGYETLRYHKTKDDNVHYKYTYYDECKKVKVRQKKDGVICITNRSGEMSDEEIIHNVRAAIKKGINTCGTAYSR